MNPRSVPAWPAGTLLYALVIVAVLAMTSAAFIGLSSWQRLLFERDGLRERLTRHAVEGIDCLLRPDAFPGRQTVLLPLYDGEDTLLLERRPWGAFDLCLARTWRHTARRRETARCIALAGLAPDSIGRSALYLQDRTGSLMLAGNARIRGDAYLPMGGIRAGYVNTRGFTGRKLLDGAVKRSERRLPPLDEDRLRRLLALVPGQPAPGGIVPGHPASDPLLSGPAIPGHLLPPDPLRVPPAEASIPFDTVPLVIRARVLDLAGHRLAGNIVLLADSLIIAGPGARLENVLLFAPEIRIDSGCTGAFQAFATRSLLVRDGAVLDYPSVLALLQPPAPATAPAPATVSTPATLGLRCHLSGFLFTWRPDLRTDEPPPAVYIGDGSIVLGQVYAAGSLELHGAVHGHATCATFMLHTPVTDFGNHLLDAVIDATLRPPPFAGTMLSGDARAPRRVARWLAKPD